MVQLTVTGILVAQPLVTTLSLVYRTTTWTISRTAYDASCHTVIPATTDVTLTVLATDNSSYALTTTCGGTVTATATPGVYNWVAPQPRQDGVCEFTAQVTNGPAGNTISDVLAVAVRIVP